MYYGYDTITIWMIKVKIIAVEVLKFINHFKMDLVWSLSMCSPPY